MDCGNPIPPQYMGRRCPKCLTAALESKTSTSADHYNSRDIADLMGLTSEEQVRRLSRAGKIPGRVPGIKQHLFVQPVINQWIKQNQILPKVPTNPLQEEAKKRCENKDHDWLFDEKFNGIAYRTYDDLPQQGEEVLKVGHKYRRSCYFCGYSITVAVFPNL